MCVLPVDAASVVGDIALAGFPGLRDLTLSNARVPLEHSAVGEVVASPALPALKELRLRYGRDDQLLCRRAQEMYAYASW